MEGAPIVLTAAQDRNPVPAPSGWRHLAGAGRLRSA